MDTDYFVKYEIVDYETLMKRRKGEIEKIRGFVEKDRKPLLKFCWSLEDGLEKTEKEFYETSNKNNGYVSSDKIKLSKNEFIKLDKYHFNELHN